MFQQEDSGQKQVRGQTQNFRTRTQSSKVNNFESSLVRFNRKVRERQQNKSFGVIEKIFKLMKAINNQQLSNRRKNKLILSNIQNNLQKIKKQLEQKYQLKQVQLEQKNKANQLQYQKVLLEKNKVVDEMSKRLENSNEIIKSLKQIIQKNQDNKKSISEDSQNFNKNQNQSKSQNKQDKQKLNEIMQLQIVQLKIQKQQIQQQTTQLRIKNMQLQQKIRQITKQNQNYRITCQKSINDMKKFELQISDLKQINDQLNYKVNEVQQAQQNQVKLLTDKINSLTNQKNQLSSKLQQISINYTKLQKQLQTVNQQPKLTKSTQNQLQALKKQKQSVTQQVSILQQINKSLITQQQQNENIIKNMKQQIAKLESKLQQKQKQFFQLLSNSKNDQLQKQITHKNKQITQLKNRIVNISQTHKRKQQQFNQYKKQTINILENQQKNSQVAIQQPSASEQNRTSSKSSYYSKDKQQDILQAQLEIIRCKYSLLQKMYIQIKHEKQLNLQNRIQAEVQTQLQYFSQKGYGKQEDKQSLEDDQEIRNSLSNTTPRPLKKKTLSGYNLFKDNQQPKLDISIAADSTNYNKIKSAQNSALNSPAASLYNFNNFLTHEQLQKKIKNFNYTNSILHKMSTSKLITNPTSKIAFVFQYACYLELYFSSSFLSTVMEQLIMGQDMQVKILRKQDFAQEALEDQGSSKNMQSSVNVSRNGRQQDSSFLNQSKSSSRVLSSNKMYIANQYSMNSIARAENSISRRNSLHLNSNLVSQNLTYKTTKKSVANKINKIQQQLAQIQKFLVSYSIKPEKLSENLQTAQKLSQLQNNKITKLILKLIKQNQVMKKCVNVMLQNEQNITQTNNDIYFGLKQQEEKSINQQLVHSSEDQMGGPRTTKTLNKQNCSIM